MRTVVYHSLKSLYIDCLQSPIPTGLSRSSALRNGLFQAVSDVPNECQIYLRGGGQFRRRREKNVFLASQPNSQPPQQNRRRPSPRYI